MNENASLRLMGGTLSTQQYSKNIPQNTRQSTMGIAERGLQTMVLDYQILGTIGTHMWGRIKLHNNQPNLGQNHYSIHKEMFEYHGGGIIRGYERQNNQIRDQK